MKISTFTLLIFVITATVLQGQNLKVETIQFGTDVDNRNIVNVDSAFANSVDRVYCFTEISGAGDTATTITHVWYYDDRERARVELPVKGDNWRTWSSKFILENWTGEWSVDILDSEGKILATKTFRIGQG